MSRPGRSENYSFPVSLDEQHALVMARITEILLPFTLHRPCNIHVVWVAVSLCLPQSELIEVRGISGIQLTIQSHAPLLIIPVPRFRRKRLDVSSLPRLSLETP